MDTHQTTVGESSNRATEEDFISTNLPTVEKIAASYRPRLPQSFLSEDLLQAGRLGLVIAARTYNPAFGPADYWAKFCIRREIQNVATRHEAWRWAKERESIERAENIAAPTPVAEELDPEAQRTVECLQECIDQLTSAERKLINLMYEHSYSLRQIGRNHLIPGHAERSVRRMHKEALGKLQVAMMEKKAA